MQIDFIGWLTGIPEWIFGIVNWIIGIVVWFVYAIEGVILYIWLGLMANFEFLFMAVLFPGLIFDVSHCKEGRLDV